MPVAIEKAEALIENENKIEVGGKIYERSQQDGELYSKPTIGIIYPPPEVRSILSNKLLIIFWFLM